MAPQVRDELTGTATADGSGNVTVTRPSNIQNGDHLVCIIAVGDDLPATSASGWTNRGGSSSATGNDRQISLLSKLITDAASEPSSYTFTVAGSGDTAAWWIASISGLIREVISGTNPVEAYGTNNVSNDASPAALSITTVSPDAFLIAGWGTNYDATADMSSMGGSWAIEANNIILDPIALNVASMIKVAVGATGDVEIILDPVSTTAETSASQWALRAARFPSVSSSVTVSDYSNVSITAGLPQPNVFDSVAVSEYSNVRINPLRTPLSFESLVVTEESKARVNPLMVSVFDGVSVSDFSGAKIPVLISVYDSLSITDTSSTLLRFLLIQVNDSVTVADATTELIKQLHVASFDLVTLSYGSSQLVPRLNISTSDQVTLSESDQRFINPLYTSVFDTVTLTEDRTVTRAGALSINVFDGVTVSTSLTASFLNSSRRRGVNESISTYGDVTRDYQVGELTVWEAATDENLVTLKTSYVLECYDDQASYNDRVDINGATTSSSYFRIIRPAAGHGHNGTPNVGVHFIYSSTDAALFNIVESYCQVQDLIATLNINSATTRGTFLVQIGQNIVIAGCIACNGTNSPGAGTAIGFYAYGTAVAPLFVNCLAHNNDGNGFDLNMASSGQTHYIYNCSSTNNAARGFQFASTGTTEIAILKNCLASDNTTGDFIAVGAGLTKNITYCASKDLTADDWGGAGNRTGCTFRFYDSGNDDFHLTSLDNEAKGHGVDLSGNTVYPFNDDIDKEIRTGGNWDIGFDAQFKTLSFSVSDTVTLSSGVTVSKTTIEALTLLVYDELLTSESISTLIKQLNLSVSDTLYISEYVKALFGGMSISVDDALLISDYSNTALKNLVASVSDSVVVSEYIKTLLKQLNVSASENIALSEARSLLLNRLLVSTSDTVTLSEDRTVFIFTGAYGASVYETIQALDWVEVSKTYAPFYTVNVSDALTLSDSIIALIKALLTNVYESLTISESSTLKYQQLPVNVSDLITLTEQIALQFRYLNITTEDVVEVVDSVLLSIVLSGSPLINVYDNVYLAEQISFWFKKLYCQVYDALSLSEYTKLTKVLHSGVYDTVTMGDTITVAPLPAAGTLWRNLQVTIITPKRTTEFIEPELLIYTTTPIRRAVPV